MAGGAARLRGRHRRRRGAQRRAGPDRRDRVRDRLRRRRACRSSPGACWPGAAQIVAVDRDPAKLELARARGATDACSRARTRRARCGELTGGGGRRPRVRGRRAGGDDPASRGTCCAPAATAIVVGIAPRGVEVCVPALELLSEKRLRGCFYGSGDVAAELPGLVELALAGRIDLAGVVSHVAARRGAGGARAAAPRRGRAHRAGPGREPRRGAGERGRVMRRP